jgi:hypothetical protein
MKYCLLAFILISSIFSVLPVSFAESIASSSTQSITQGPDTGNTDNLLWFDWDKIRNWDFTIDDIPNTIVNIIEFLLGIAGTLSVVALIYHALQMQIHSGITGDSSGVDKAKAWMKWAILGFVVSMLAWFIIARVVDIFTSLS